MLESLRRTLAQLELRLYMPTKFPLQVCNHVRGTCSRHIIMPWPVSLALILIIVLTLSLIYIQRDIEVRLFARSRIKLWTSGSRIPLLTLLLLRPYIYMYMYGLTLVFLRSHIYIQGSYSTWQSGNAWKMSFIFSSQGNIR